ncbi:MAG: hypothetical protein AAFV07_12645, partial [Bacteroidota bacterium]
EVLSGLIDGTSRDGGLIVQDLRFGEIGLLQTHLLMDISIQNQLPLDYALESIRIDLYPNNHSQESLGKWQKFDTLFVAQDSIVQFPVDFTLNNIALMSAVPDILRDSGDGQIEKMILAGKIHLALDDRRFVIPFKQPVGALIKRPIISTEK